jgi:prepilin-type N-terminal cleavage/methylation domain-containing protein
MIQMKKLNNKGFSLVELIIVIAIMAILVGVVGTQVIPYLEKSRKAKDIQILSGWNTAAVSAYSSEAANLDAASTYTITIADDTAVAVAQTPSADTNKEKKLKDAFLDLTEIPAAGYDFDDMDSKAGKDITQVVITINGASGQVVTSATNADTSGKLFFDDIENK